MADTGPFTDLDALLIAEHVAAAYRAADLAEKLVIAELCRRRPRQPVGVLVTMRVQLTRARERLQALLPHAADIACDKTLPSEPMTGPIRGTLHIAPDPGE